MAKKKNYSHEDFPITYQLRGFLHPLALLVGAFFLAIGWIVATAPDRTYPIYVGILIGVGGLLLFPTLFVLRNLIAKYTGWYAHIGRFFGGNEQYIVFTKYKMKDASWAGLVILLAAFLLFEYLLNT